MSLQKGGAAFPRAAYEGKSFIDEGAVGMDLLDYFAAKAMEQLLAGALSSKLDGTELQDLIDGIGDTAYAMARMMLHARALSEEAQ